MKLAVHVNTYLIITETLFTHYLHTTYTPNKQIKRRTRASHSQITAQTYNNPIYSNLPHVTRASSQYILDFTWMQSVICWIHWICLQYSACTHALLLLMPTHRSIYTLAAQHTLQKALIATANTPTPHRNHPGLLTSPCLKRDPHSAIWTIPSTHYKTRNAPNESSAKLQHPVFPCGPPP